MPDVVVLVPGILGSVLRKDGRDVWGPSMAAGTAAIASLGGSVRDLTLSGDAVDADDLGDGVAAEALVPDVHLLPYVWKIDGYTHVSRTIQSAFDVTPGKNYFEFPYDWRRDNRVAARQLADKSRGWLARWRTMSGRTDAKLIFVAHSMGGLVARYFVEVMGGWTDTKALLTFGTPYRGALSALESLVGGVRKGPLGVVDLSSFVRSLTSVYQLLPIYPCVEGGDGRMTRISEGPDLPHVVRQRAADALDFHRRISTAVEDNEKEDAYRRARYAVFPIVGIQQPTMQSARLVRPGVVEFLRAIEGADERGDGTVPRVSATPIELSEAKREVFVATRHASIQNANAALTHLEGAVTGLYIDLGRYRAALPSAPIEVSLLIEDAYWDSEPIRFSIRTSLRPSPALHGRVTDTAAGRDVASFVARAGHEDWADVELEPLPPGTYRLTVAGYSAVQVVSDLFTVVGNDLR